MIKDGVVTAYTYNELNQITKASDINCTWDNAGNLVSQSTDTGVLVASYTYDCQNRMIAATVSNASGTLWRLTRMTILATGQVIRCQCIINLAWVEKLCWR